MRAIKRATHFKKDFKRVLANPLHMQDVPTLLMEVLAILVENKPLLENCSDHALIGNWKNYRECHVKPDLLLIYQIEEPNKLYLARLSSHSELFKS